MKTAKLLKTILEDAAQRTHFARSVYNPSEAVQDAFTNGLQEAATAAPSHVRFFLVDTARFSDTAALFRHILLSLAEDPRAKDDDISISARRIQKATDEKSACLEIECILDDYTKTDVHIVLVLTHFDAAPAYWGSNSCGWLREAINTLPSFSCIIAGAKPVFEITKLPAGSSPLFNIFSNTSLEGDFA